MKRVLVLAATTGYQTRSFGDAAARLGVELLFATDRCHVIDDPWQDGAVPIRFYDEAGSVATILDRTRTRPVDGILVVGDRPTVIAARVAEALGLPGHPPAAAAAAGHKRLTRERLRDAGLKVPDFTAPRFPCVVKPVALTGSRGVIRADDPASLDTAIERVRAILTSVDVRNERNGSHQEILIEEFIPGHEFALEGVLHHGRFYVLAVFDKPDALDGPFFEETIYVTPPPLDAAARQAIEAAVAGAAHAIGLHHGPIHAECRVATDGVYVLEVAARPIGGLCARAVRFTGGETLEEMLLRHAVGESPARWRREEAARGVMMIPIPRRGVLRGVDGVDQARRIDGVEEVQITAKLDQVLIPLPEGASYLGFIFAGAPGAGDVTRALRDAHRALRVAIDPELPMLTPSALQYNHHHG